MISWGWARRPGFVGRNQWQGTRDIAAFLATPDAIDFQAANDWATVRANCHAMVAALQARLCARYGTTPIQSDNATWIAQMAAIPLPIADPEAAAALHDRLWERYQIELPPTGHDGQLMLRVSVQGYTTEADLAALEDALEREL